MNEGLMGRLQDGEDSEGHYTLRMGCFSTKADSSWASEAA
jgi:hypothetical protein